MNTPHSKHTHVHAVVRYDFDLEEPENRIAIPKVFESAEQARAEVDRLNELNADKKCRYFAVVTRLVKS